MFNLQPFTIQKQTRKSDGRGGWPNEWVNASTEWGTVGLKSLTFTERVQLGQEQGRRGGAEISHVGVFRVGADIARGDRIIDRNGIVYQVDSRRLPEAGAMNAEFQLKEKQTATTTG